MTVDPVELNQFRDEILKLLTHRTESREMGFDQDPPTVSESRFWTKYRLFEVMATVGHSSWSVEISHGDHCACVSWNKERPTHLTIHYPSRTTLELEVGGPKILETATEHLVSYFFEGVISHDYNP